MDSAVDTGDKRGGRIYRPASPPRLGDPFVSVSCENESQRTSALHCRLAQWSDSGRVLTTGFPLWVRLPRDGACDRAGRGQGAEVLTMSCDVFPESLLCDFLAER